MFDECKRKEGVIDEELEKMFEQDKLEDRKSKCMANCMMKSFTVVRVWEIIA